ncbi:hypothetical protein OEZ86_000227 [Tetradesmus obliquus]|nr:hypothetical protein OEZ86_000227 [Tetradesmus obliquus]
MRSSSPRPASRPASSTKIESVVTTAAKLKAPVYISEACDDQQAVELFQKWLQVPRLKQLTEEELVASSSLQLQYINAEQDNPSFEDAVFPTETSPEEQQAHGPVVWRRVTGNLYTPSSQHARLVQGVLQSSGSSSWFLGALAAVSRKQELLLNLIVSDECAQRGLYTVRFFKHGSWRPVVVDNRLPCMEQQQRLAFCSSGQAQELWPSLIEKAYARLHGGYAAIAAGSVGDALVDLTGGVVSKVSLSTEEHMQDAATGGLWTSIEQWLAAGSIIACMAKQPQDAAKGSLMGVLPNTPYSILEARVLPGGSKLLRLHCPWAPNGMWQGPWGLQCSSQEWMGEEGQAALAQDAALAAGLQDLATFWCTYWEFIQVFNRCWVVQLMPESWHQISLSSGWVGASAGGPAATTGSPGAAAAKEPGHAQAYPSSDDSREVQSTVAQAVQDGGVLESAASPQQQQQQQQQQGLAGASVSMSSSWCCNPQFRLSVAGSGTVMVCLGQQDPQVHHQRHQPKRQRDFHIGLTLLRDKPAAGSSSSSSSSSTAAGLSSSREVVLRFRAQAGESYMLVPYTRRAGDTGPFTLRVYGPHAMQLEQLPSPMSLVLGGQWLAHQAGGRSCHASWGSNPQYLISCQRETTALLALLRPDVANSLVPQPFDPQQCIGLTLAVPEVTPGGWGRRCCIPPGSSGRELVHAESDFCTMAEAVLLVRLQPEVPYVLVPSTADPGIEAPFELRLLSSYPIELVPLPSAQTISHSGAWDAATAGGSNLHASWVNNPAYLLRLPSSVTCRISLTRIGRSSRTAGSQRLNDMLGFYVIRAARPHTAAGGRHKSAAAALKQAQLFESAFLPADSCEAELQLPAGVLLLVPCTFGPGVVGRYCLSVSSVAGTAGAGCNFSLEHVSGGLAAAGEQLMQQAAGS